ncbi:MAG: peptidylprolyl isomerase [Candidatus Hydrogenedentes bacterium]|nr:peptidylprolyl isomerase [Candidatus Hydrogenedentota bacterium]
MLRQVCTAGAILLCILGVTSARAAMVDSIVATVDTEVILYSELMEELAPYLASLQQGGADAASYERDARKALEDTLAKAIEQRILYREAQLAGHSIPDDVVEDRLATYKQQYGSEEEFNQALTETGQTLSEFRDNLKRQILAISMGLNKRRALEAEAVVSAADMAQYYQDNTESFRRPERVLLRRIFLACGAEQPEAEQAKVRARLDAIRDELNAGASFEDLATKYSEGPASEVGGLVGWQARGELVPELESVAFSLQPGEVSAPVQTQFGFALMTVDQREEAGLASLDEVRTEIEPLLRSNYAEERYQLWMDDLKKRSRVQVFL